MAQFTLTVHAMKTSQTKFTVTASTRKEAEDIIANKLRSGELVWEDYEPDRVGVVCFYHDGTVWRPRRYFYLVEDQYDEDFPQG